MSGGWRAVDRACVGLCVPSDPECIEQFHWLPPTLALVNGDAGEEEKEKKRKKKKKKRNASCPATKATKATKSRHRVQGEPTINNQCCQPKNAHRRQEEASR